MPTTTRVLLLACCLLLVPAGRANASDFPAPSGKVNDFAGLLSVADRQDLESQLAELERATSAEVAVVTVRSTSGRTIEEYTAALFAEWGIGKKEADNGVLLLVAVDDRTLRIEVGYGLEGILPDGLAGAIIRETITPRFRENDYRQGILDGVARIADCVRRHEVLTQEQRARLDAQAADAGRDWPMAVLLGPFIAAGAFVAGASLGARVVTELLFGVVFAGAPLYFSQFVAPRWSIPWLFALGIAVAAWGYRVGRRPWWRRHTRGTGRGGGGSGWVMSSSSSGSSSRSGSSSSGGSGGSFGGGSSGGGGASGSW